MDWLVLVLLKLLYGITGGQFLAMKFLGSILDMSGIFWGIVFKNLITVILLSFANNLVRHFANKYFLLSIYNVELISGIVSSLCFTLYKKFLISISLSNSLCLSMFLVNKLSTSYSNLIWSALSSFIISSLSDISFQRNLR